MAKLGEVCLINPKSCTLRDDTEVSFIPMTKVGEHGEFDTSEIKNYSEVKKGFTNFQNGDILFAKITPCMENGKGAIAHNMKNGIGFGSTEFHVLRPDTDKITSEWLYYLTTWKTFRKEAERNMTGSAGQKRVPKTFLENYVVNLPEIDAQKSESIILRKVDDLISLRKQQLAKLDELVKAQFVEMFGVVHNSVLYPYVPVESFTSVVSGGTPNRNVSEFWNNGSIRWVKTTELQNNVICNTDEKITQAGLDNSSAKIIPPSTVLIAMYGQGKTRGMTGYTSIECATNQACACILPCEQFNQNYLWRYMILSYNKLRDMAKGGNQPNLNIGIIKNFPVLKPPIELQNDFAAFVERVDQQKQAVQQSLEKLELMKKALMQEYFG